jgi:hypothetical protein
MQKSKGKSAQWWKNLHFERIALLTGDVAPNRFLSRPCSNQSSNCGLLEAHLANPCMLGTEIKIPKHGCHISVT